MMRTLFFKMIPVFLSLFWGFAESDAQTSGETDPGEIYIRINQLGYLPEEYKCAILFSGLPVKGPVQMVSAESGEVVKRIRPRSVERSGWGRFEYYYEADFTSVKEPGRYYLEISKGEVRTPKFRIGTAIYSGEVEKLLGFMRQQRCGYNPFLDMVCHRKDGRTFYGPMPDSTYIDVSGGWHDAGDQLKYLITGSYATAHMLLAYELYPERFGDLCDDLGRPGSNGIPDVLDEARWGLEWIHKLHPSPEVLVHQVGDDRDHVGWKMPDNDHSDYGWGPNSYRVAYVASGKPQGLREYQSMATGVSNLAGRSAAAMALAARIWRDDMGDEVFATRCLRDAKSLYLLGRKREGYQQGNSYGAPYRYGEETWADDMEWAAAELFRQTGERKYLEEATDYARKAGSVSWMPFDTAAHYQYYPFINMGHFALHQVAEEPFRDSLEQWYRSGIERCLQRAASSPFHTGIPFIWCSNNLMTALITQIILYERMSGDDQYRDFMVEQRDWLLGRNPWGTSMFTGIPEGGEYPVDVHTSTWALTRREVPGGLVDGPVYGTIFRSLRGLTLYSADEFAQVQNPFVVYHDDIGDYSTNEPTMDGTAGAVLMMVHWAGGRD